MLRPITTSSASASSAPTAVQAGTAAHLSTSNTRATTVGAVDSPHAQTSTGNAEQRFRYNSFEFVYRQDIGRIVLVGQSPETGERVIQVPSEQVLRAYERTVRVERQFKQDQGARAVAPQTSPNPAPAPQLAKALVAAISGDNHGSGVISVSA